MSFFMFVSACVLLVLPNLQSTAGCHNQHQRKYNLISWHTSLYQFKIGLVKGMLWTVLVITLNNY